MRRESFPRLYRHIGVDGVARENWLKLGGVRRLWWLQGRGRVAAATRMSQFSPQPEGPGPILPISASLLARRQPVSVVRRSSISAKIGSRRHHPYMAVQPRVGNHKLRPATSQLLAEMGAPGLDFETGDRSNLTQPLLSIYCPISKLYQAIPNRY